MGEPVLAISQYLLRYWARHLGPEALCLVIAARQLAYEAQRGAQSGETAFRASRATLARRAGVSESTVRRRLADSAPLSAFLRAERGRFRVRRDDPLCPEHARGLAAYLGRVGPEGVRESLSALCHKPVAEARSLLETCAQDARQGGEEADVSHTLRRLGLTEQPEALCRAVQRHLVQPKKVILIPYRFWRVWLPRLGPRRAGLLLNLRTRCYHNPSCGEVRDTFRVPYGHLAAELGLSYRQLQRLLSAQDPLADLVAVVESGRGKAATTLRLRLDRFQAAPKSDTEAAYPADKEPRTRGQQSGLRGREIGLPDRASYHLSPKHRKLLVDRPFSRRGGADDVLEAGAWERIQGELACQVGQDTYYTQMRPLQPLAWRRGEGEEPPTLELRARSDSDAEWLNYRSRRLLEETISRVLGYAVQVTVRGPG